MCVWGCVSNVQYEEIGPFWEKISFIFRIYSLCSLGKGRNNKGVCSCEISFNFLLIQRASFNKSNQHKSNGTSWSTNLLFDKLVLQFKNVKRILLSDLYIEQSDCSIMLSTVVRQSSLGYVCKYVWSVFNECTDELGFRKRFESELSLTEAVSCQSVALGSNRFIVMKPVLKSFNFFCKKRTMLIEMIFCWICDVVSEPVL